MAANVFLASVDPGNFETTVRTPVDLTDHSDRPDALSGAESARLWAVTEGASGDTYEKLASGDLVLFYADGEYVGTGRVGTTFEDDEQWVSETFWEDAPATSLYTVESFEPVTVPKAAVNRIFDYSEGYTPQELLRVADSRVDRSPDAIELAVQQYSAKHA